MNLRKLIGLCNHYWNVIEEINVFTSKLKRIDGVPQYRDYILKCTHCGYIKVKRV